MKTKLEKTLRNTYDLVITYLILASFAGGLYVITIVFNSYTNGWYGMIATLVLILSWLGNQYALWLKRKRKRLPKPGNQ